MYLLSCVYLASIASLALIEFFFSQFDGALFKFLLSNFVRWLRVSHQDNISNSGADGICVTFTQPNPLPLSIYLMFSHIELRKEAVSANYDCLQATFIGLASKVDHFFPLKKIIIACVYCSRG